MKYIVTFVSVWFLVALPGVDAQKKAKSLSKAVFAGGCFWCIEPPFEKLKGVESAISGYKRGREKNPSYDQVSAGQTSHVEAVEVTYDAKQITYRELLEVFWRNIDPTQANGQFYDVGSQYRTVIFVRNPKELKAAQNSKEKLAKSGKFSKPIVTEIVPYTNFYPAEDYHQDYYKKNPENYYRYRKASGRDAFIKKHWPE